MVVNGTNMAVDEVVSPRSKSVSVMFSPSGKALIKAFLAVVSVFQCTILFCATEFNLKLHYLSFYLSFSKTIMVKVK